MKEHIRRKTRLLFTKDRSAARSLAHCLKAASMRSTPGRGRFLLLLLCFVCLFVCCLFACFCCCCCCFKKLLLLCVCCSCVCAVVVVCVVVVVWVVNACAHLSVSVCTLRTLNALRLLQTRRQTACRRIIYTRSSRQGWVATKTPR